MWKWKWSGFRSGLIKEIGWWNIKEMGWWNIKEMGWWNIKEMEWWNKKIERRLCVLWTQ